VSGNFVDLRTTNGPISVTFAHKDTDYFFSEGRDVVGAWGPFPDGFPVWLYWDIDRQTGQRTFGHTTVEPIASISAPLDPVEDQHWFNTGNATHFVWQSGRWVEVIRVFAARYDGGGIPFGALGSNSQLPFAGTQVGLVGGTVFAGTLLFDEAGNPIVKSSNGTFYTTETEFFSGATRINGIRLESDVITGVVAQNTPAYSVVRFGSDNRLQLAEYNDSELNAIAITTQQGLVNDLINVVAQGVVVNEQWNWPNIGAALYIGAGGVLTEEDAHDTNPSVFPIARVPVARVIGRRSVIFQQGLGGVGPAGPAGSVGNLPFASSTERGTTFLDVDPATGTLPIAVGVNSPLLAGAPFAPLAHLTDPNAHPATSITFAPSGNLTSTDVQAALEELDTFAQSIAAGFDPKESVRAATNGPLAGAVYTPTNGFAGTGQFTSPPTVIDGVTLQTGDRVLVKDQADPRENGIYTVVTAGGFWDRAPDQNGTPSAEVSAGNFTVVEQGAVNTNVGWILAGNGELTLNTDPLVWVRFSGGVPLSHLTDPDAHTAANITNVAAVSTQFGTPSVVADVAATDVQGAVNELLDEKALARPAYTAFGNLPDATTASGMYAFVSGDDKHYVSDGVDWIGLIREDSNLTIDIPFFARDTWATPGDIMASYVAARTITVPAGAPGSVAVANTPAASNTSFDLVQVPVGGVGSFIVGTVDFAAGSNVGTFNVAANFGLIAGEQLRLVASAPVDGTIADISVNIVGCAPLAVCIPVTPAPPPVVGPELLIFGYAYDGVFSLDPEDPPIVIADAGYLVDAYAVTENSDLSDVIAQGGDPITSITIRATHYYAAPDNFTQVERETPPEYPSSEWYALGTGPNPTYGVRLTYNAASVDYPALTPLDITSLTGTFDYTELAGGTPSAIGHWIRAEVTAENGGGGETVKALYLRRQVAQPNDLNAIDLLLTVDGWVDQHDAPVTPLARNAGDWDPNDLYAYDRLPAAVKLSAGPNASSNATRIRIVQKNVTSTADGSTPPASGWVPFDNEIDVTGDGLVIGALGSNLGSFTGQDNTVVLTDATTDEHVFLADLTDIDFTNFFAEAPNSTPGAWYRMEVTAQNYVGGELDAQSNTETVDVRVGSPPAGTPTLTINGPVDQAGEGGPSAFTNLRDAITIGGGTIQSFGLRFTAAEFNTTSTSAGPPPTTGWQPLSMPELATSSIGDLESVSWNDDGYYSSASRLVPRNTSSFGTGVVSPVPLPDTTTFFALGGEATPGVWFRYAVTAVNASGASRAALLTMRVGSDGVVPTTPDFQVNGFISNPIAPFSGSVIGHSAAASTSSNQINNILTFPGPSVGATVTATVTHYAEITPRHNLTPPDYPTDADTTWYVPGTGPESTATLSVGPSGSQVVFPPGPSVVFDVSSGFMAAVFTAGPDNSDEVWWRLELEYNDGVGGIQTRPLYLKFSETSYGTIDNVPTLSAEGWIDQTMGDVTPAQRIPNEYNPNDLHPYDSFPDAVVQQVDSGGAATGRTLVPTILEKNLTATLPGEAPPTAGWIPFGGESETDGLAMGVAWRSGSTGTSTDIGSIAVIGGDDVTVPNLIPAPWRVSGPSTSGTARSFETTNYFAELPGSTPGAWYRVGLIPLQADFYPQGGELIPGENEPIIIEVKAGPAVTGGNGAPTLVINGPVDQSPGRDSGSFETFADAITVSGVAGGSGTGQLKYTLVAKNDTAPQAGATPPTTGWVAFDANDPTDGLIINNSSTDGPGATGPFTFPAQSSFISPSTGTYRCLTPSTTTNYLAERPGATPGTWYRFLVTATRDSGSNDHGARTATAYLDVRVSNTGGGSGVEIPGLVTLSAPGAFLVDANGATPAAGGVTQMSDLLVVDPSVTILSFTPIGFVDAASGSSGNPPPAPGSFGTITAVTEGIRFNPLTQYSGGSFSGYPPQTDVWPGGTPSYVVNPYQGVLPDDTGSFLNKFITGGGGTSASGRWWEVEVRAERLDGDFTLLTVYMADF
jgi:hypothetical protein